MPKFMIEANGRRYEVEAPSQEEALSALSLLPQGGTTPETADKYRAAAAEDFARNPALQFGSIRRAFQGATLGFGDELLAGLNTPAEMIRRGIADPAEAYRYAKAYQDVALEEARKRQGFLGDAAEFVGGMALPGGAMAKGLTLVGKGAGLARRVLGGGTEAALYGAASGFGEGQNVQDRMERAQAGALLGGGLGAGLPAAGAAIGAVAKPVASNIAAFFNPERAATQQVARAVNESKRNLADILADVRQAAGEGQPVYTVADALGNPGQRLLAAVARTPGPGRTAAVDFLETRQAGQGRRLINALAEGLEAPTTAEQARAALKAARSAAADENYARARASAGIVDVSRAVSVADDLLGKVSDAIKLNPAQQVAEDSVQSAISKARSYLTNDNVMLVDFDRLLRAKREIDHLIETGSPTQQFMLSKVRNALDDALAESSAPYAKARDLYREHSRIIDAIEPGQIAARRGRFEDIVRDFEQLTPAERSAYRVGFADSLIGKIERKAEGANKARDVMTLMPLLEKIASPDKVTQLQGRLGREMTMFDTYRHALGGSPTAENLADISAVTATPSLLGNLLRGNIGTALQQVPIVAGNLIQGRGPEVREHIARLLLQGGREPSLAPIVEAAQAQARNRLLRQLATRGAAIGAAHELVQQP